MPFVGSGVVGSSSSKMSPALCTSGLGLAGLVTS